MSENFNNSNIQNISEDESTLSLNDIWGMIWGYKWWYVACVCFCLMVVCFNLYKTPNTYQRTAKVIIDETEQSSAMRSLTSISGVMPGLRANATVANEMEAFSSPDLMQKVVERLNLETRYVEQQFLRSVEYYQNSPVELRLVEGNPQTGFAFTLVNKGEKGVVLEDFVVGSDEVDGKIHCAIGDTVTTPAGVIMLIPTMNIEDFDNDIRISWSNSMTRAKGFCQNLTVSLSGKESTVIVLSLDDTFPGRASSILNSLIDTYNENWVRNKNRSARKTSEFINERLLLIEKELGGVENELKRYKEQNKLTDMNALARKYLEESSEYSSKAFEVKNQLSIANYIKEYLNDPANAAALIPANLGLGSSNVESQISEYNELVLQRDRLSNGSGSNNPLIADLNASLGSMRTAILRSIDNYVATLELQVQKIESQESQILERIAASSGQELQLLSIQRQQMVKESLYVFLLQKREENEIAALVNVGNTRLIMNPNGSSRPIAPNKMMLLLIAIVLGCGIPFAVIFLIRVLDTTVKDKSDFSDMSVPFLAEIPLAVRRNKFGYISRASKYDNQNCKILVEQGKRDMMNEAFRVLRTNLDMVIEKEAGKAFVAMFTSFNPNAGKTFVIQNIAASMALKNSKVLLLDLDLRKATLSLSLNKEHRGVAAYLNGKESDFHPHVDQISDNLYLLPVGKLPPNPAELLLSDRFKNMIEELRHEYDYIFMDCPPIDIVADAAILTKYVDMTVFIIRSGLFDKKGIASLDNMYNLGKYKRMAVVLNGVDVESKRYSYGYGCGYGYGYGYGYDYGNDKK